MSDRFSSIDIIKGFFIIAMIVLHGVMQQIGQYDPAVFVPIMSSLPTILLILVLPLILIGIMGAIYTLLTCLVATLQLWHLWETDRRKIPSFLLTRLLIGVFILVSWRISSLLINILTQRPLVEYFQSISWDQFIIYNSQTLDSIAWVGVIVPVMLYLILLIFNSKRPLLLIALFLFFAALSFGLSPLVISFGESLMGPIRSHNYYVLEFILSKIIYGRFKIVQTIAFGFIGVVFGILLAIKRPFKVVAYVGFGIAGVSLLTFIVWLIISPEFVISHFADEDVPLPVLILALFVTLCFILYFLKQHQFCASEEIRIRHAKRSTWIRRYSVVSLTAFVWGTAFADLIYAFFAYFWDQSIDRTGVQPVLRWSYFQVFVFLLVLLLAWEIILRLWEKLHYVLSLEWWMHLFLSLLAWKKRPYTVSQIIYGPNQIFPSDTKIAVKE